LLTYYAKLEVSISAGYEDMKGGTKRIKWGGFRELYGSLKVTGNRTIRQSA